MLYRPGYANMYHGIVLTAPHRSQPACANGCTVCASPTWSFFSATMAVPSAERLREKNLLPLCDGKSEVWGYFGFLQHKDNQTTDLSKVVIVETLAGSLLS